MRTQESGNRHFIEYGQKTIDYSLVYCDRKTMEIAVLPDRSVIVKAPFHTDIPAIEKKIRKRAGWILKQKNYFSQFDPGTPARAYVNGETHLYLGKQYRLKIAEGPGNSVKLCRGYFYVTCRGMVSPEKAKRLLEKWYLEKARKRFAESLERSWQKFDDKGVEKPRVSIRRMKTRWGSLSDKGTLTLNTDLIKAPKECIDYVVTHELCHLKYRNHGPAFYRLLSSILPGWERVKDKLELGMA